MFLLGLVALAAVPGIRAQEPCPPGLAEAAAEYRVRAQEEEDRIRQSTLKAPAGVQEVAQFDLAAHACHKGPGQAYKVFGDPVCTAVGGRSATLRYPYELYFRKAMDLADLYRASWEEGSEGILQVEFQREEGRWIPVGRTQEPGLPGTGDAPPMGHQ